VQTANAWKPSFFDRHFVGLLQLLQLLHYCQALRVLQWMNPPEEVVQRVPIAIIREMT
jgi:hypothetical protein